MKYNTEYYIWVTKPKESNNENCTVSYVVRSRPMIPWKEEKSFKSLKEAEKYILKIVHN